MSTAISNQQQRQMIWNRRLAQMDHDTQLASARIEGEARGEVRGKAKGEKKLAQIISKLITLGRNQANPIAAEDPAYREKLYAELNIK